MDLQPLMDAYDTLVMYKDIIIPAIVGAGSLSLGYIRGYRSGRKRHETHTALVDEGAGVSQLHLYNRRGRCTRNLYRRDGDEEFHSTERLEERVTKDLHKELKNS